MAQSTDPRWPFASALLSDQVLLDRRNAALLGVPTYATSVTPRPLSATPRVIRAALARFSTWSSADQCDLLDIVSVVDYGDVENPDSADGRRRLTAAIERIDPRCELQIFLGGDNAVTALAMADVARHDLAEWGLITLDAHLDVRDGHSNGSPVRELVECGLAGSRVVQVGIADYANSASYARWAIGVGLTSISRSDVHEQGVRACLERAVQIAGDGGRPIYVDVDLDVVDRSAAPACPGAVPGGLSADELRRAVRYLAAVPTVRAVDFTEVVDEWDTPDQRTVRLVAVAVLDAIAGLGARP